MIWKRGKCHYVRHESVMLTMCRIGMKVTTGKSTLRRYGIDC
jgi:hypothetical protein